MGLSGETYIIRCDVAGCDNKENASLSFISREGWQERLIYDGKPTLAALTQTSKQCVCPDCCREGHYKTMSKIEG